MRTRTNRDAQGKRRANLHSREVPLKGRTTETQEAGGRGRGKGGQQLGTHTLQPEDGSGESREVNTKKQRK